MISIKKENKIMKLIKEITKLAEKDCVIRSEINRKTKILKKLKE
jgi:hypothetical protein